MTEAEFRQQLAAEQFAAPVSIERDASHGLDEHTHPFEAFAFITAGEITLEVQGRRTTYTAGQTFRLPAGTPHKEYAGAQGVRYLSGRKEQQA